MRVSDKRFNVGDRVFIISNGVRVDELTVISVSGTFYTLRYIATGGGTRLSAHRLFATRDEAERELANIKRGHSSDRIRPY